MNGREFWALRDIPDEQLEATLSRLLGAGARLEARIVAHLAEVDARRLHLTVGCSSLYDYCRKRLGLSDYEAFARIAAARVARKYPLVFEMLERRQLHLTAICEVREFLTAENHRALLIELSGKTKAQIREVLAHQFPQADLRSSLKKLPGLEPLSPGRYRLLVTLSAQQKEKLELARDLLSHANPSGDLAIVLERAIDELLARLEQRRFGRLSSRKPPLRTTNSSNVAQTKGRTVERVAQSVPVDERGERGERDERDERGEALEGHSAPHRARARKHIAHDTRRRLLERDGCSCAFVGSDGQRCRARAFLQFHHRRAWAHGGSESADNLQVLCQAHNRLLAERDFGRAHVERAIAHRARIDKRRHT
jgi:hypothetical protein